MNRRVVYTKIIVLDEIQNFVVDLHLRMFRGIVSEQKGIVS